MKNNQFDVPPECCGSFMDQQDDGSYRCFYCKSVETDRNKEWIEELVEQINETTE